MAGGAASGGGAKEGDWRDTIRAAHLGVLPAAGGGEGCADEGGVNFVYKWSCIAICVCISCVNSSCS